MFQSLMTRLFGRRERKKTRSKINEFFTVRVQLGKDLYKFRDYSPKGFAVINEEGHIAPNIGTEVDAEFVLYKQKTATIRAKIVRQDETMIGFEVLDKKSFKDFSEEYLSHFPKTSG
jgi:hypothetical protein